MLPKARVAAFPCPPAGLLRKLAHGLSSASSCGTNRRASSLAMPSIGGSTMPRSLRHRPHKVSYARRVLVPTRTPFPEQGDIDSHGQSKHFRCGGNYGGRRDPYIAVGSRCLSSVRNRYPGSGIRTRHFVSANHRQAWSESGSSPLHADRSCVGKRRRTAARKSSSMDGCPRAHRGSTGDPHPDRPR